MSSRRPRRQRRRRDRGSTLPRPGAVAQTAPSATAPSGATAEVRTERHIVTDYRYIRRDLVIVGVVSAITLAFVLVAAVIA